MAEAQNSNTEVPPHAQLVQMAMAHWVSHIVYWRPNWDWRIIC